MCRSEPQIPARVSRIRMAPASGSGTGYSRSSNSPPYAFSTAIRPFMTRPPLAWSRALVGSRQDGAGRREGLAGHLHGRPGPRGGIGRLVAHRTRVAPGGDRREEFLERDSTLAGREPIQRLARLEAGLRHVAVLDVRDLRRGHVVESARLGAASPEVIRVEQESARRV